jgi:hypothetical protein
MAAADGACVAAELKKKIQRAQFTQHENKFNAYETENT